MDMRTIRELASAELPLSRRSLALLTHAFKLREALRALLHQYEFDIAIPMDEQREHIQRLERELKSTRERDTSFLRELGPVDTKDPGQLLARIRRVVNEVIVGNEPACLHLRGCTTELGKLADEARRALEVIAPGVRAMVDDHWSGCQPEREAAMQAAPWLTEIFYTPDEWEAPEPMRPKTLLEIIESALVRHA